MFKAFRIRYLLRVEKKYLITWECKYMDRSQEESTQYSSRYGWENWNNRSGSLRHLGGRTVCRQFGMGELILLVTLHVQIWKHSDDKHLSAATSFTHRSCLDYVPSILLADGNHFNETHTHTSSALHIIGKKKLFHLVFLKANTSNCVTMSYMLLCKG